MLSNTPLVGFGGTKVFPVGTITLLVTIGTYPQQLTKEITFLVINYSSAYNAIIGRPTLNAWRVATFTYHLLVKFLTKYRVGQARGDQIAARNCYIVMWEMDDHLQALNIEERWVMVKPIEALEEIFQDENRLNQITCIGTQANSLVCKELTLLLRNNLEVFAWSHDDMLGIDLNITVHQLNISPFFLPFGQKKKAFAQERDKAITEEVCKLLKVGFIREVYYPEWLANIVIIKMENGKWSMFVDFTDLNRVCPKDSYPLQ